MPANRVFLDTSGWVALLNEDDLLHEFADVEFRKLGRVHGQVALTDWIIAETGNCLARTDLRVKFAKAVRAFSTNPNFRIIPVSDNLRERALDLYVKRLDKTW